MWNRKTEKTEVNILYIVSMEKKNLSPSVQMVHVDYTTLLSSGNDFIFMTANNKL